MLEIVQRSYVLGLIDVEELERRVWALLRFGLADTAAIGVVPTVSGGIEARY